MRIPALALAIVGAGSVCGCGAQVGFPINASSSIPSSVLVQGQIYELAVHSAPMNLGSASVYCDSVSRGGDRGPTASIQFSSNSAASKTPPPLVTLHVGENYSLVGVGVVTLVSISSSGGMYSVEVLVHFD